MHRWLYSRGPVLLAVFGIFFFKERVSRIQILGFLLTIIGFFIFYRQHHHAMVGSESQYTKGMLLTLTAAFTWAIYAALQKKLVVNIRSVHSMYFFGLPVLLYLPFVNFSSLAHLSIGYWALLYFSGANTLISYQRLFVASLQLPRSGESQYTYCIKSDHYFCNNGSSTWLQVGWIAGEHFSVLSISGALIALSGAILVVRKKKIRNKTDSKTN